MSRTLLGRIVASEPALPHNQNMNANRTDARPTMHPDTDLSNAHRLVKALGKSPRKLDVTEEHRARALQILHTLTSEAIRRGWKVVPPVKPSGHNHTRSTTAYAPPGRNLLAIDAGSAPINIRIRMQFRKEPHTPDPNEASKKSKTFSWDSPKWDFIPIDAIQVEVRADPYAPTVLRDGPRKSIEDGISRALQKIEDATTKALDNRRRAEEWAIERAQEEEKRREIERLTWQYESWLSPLEKLASNISQHHKVAAAVDELTAYANSLPEGSERRAALAKYITWARGHISATNPARTFMPPADDMPALPHERWRRSRSSALTLRQYS